MIDAETFWSLPRSTKPRRVFEEILPSLPALAGIFTLDLPCSVHILGAGGGVWSMRIVDGISEVHEGAAEDVVARVSISRAHLREVVGGALRERGLRLMERLGRPRAFPDLAALPIDPRKIAAVARLQGSIAIDIYDRDVRESYRFAICFGSGPPVYDAVTTVVQVDADELVEQISAGASLAALLKGSRVRLSGDLGLPLRALRAAFGADAVERPRQQP